MNGLIATHDRAGEVYSPAYSTVVQREDIPTCEDLTFLALDKLQDLARYLGLVPTVVQEELIALITEYVMSCCQPVHELLAEMTAWQKDQEKQEAELSRQSTVRKPPVFRKFTEEKQLEQNQQSQTTASPTKKSKSSASPCSSEESNAFASFFTKTSPDDRFLTPEKVDSLFKKRKVVIDLNHLDNAGTFVIGFLIF